MSSFWGLCPQTSTGPLNPAGGLLSPDPFPCPPLANFWLRHWGQLYFVRLLRFRLICVTYTIYSFSWLKIDDPEYKHRPTYSWRLFAWDSPAHNDLLTCDVTWKYWHDILTPLTWHNIILAEWEILNYKQSYLDKFVFVNDFSVQHFLRQVAHQRVKLVRVLCGRQATKITFTRAIYSANIDPTHRYLRHVTSAAAKTRTRLSQRSICTLAD